MASPTRQRFLERFPQVPEEEVDALTQLIQKKFDLKTGFAEPHQQAASLAATIKGFGLARSDNSMGQEDFQTLMQKVNCGDNRYAVVALFDRHDTRDTGRLDVNQFCDGLFGIKRVPRADPKCRDAIQLCRERILARGGENGVRSLSRLLRMMDDNGDRNLDKIEMKEGLAHYGVELTDAEAEALFGYFDTDGSGKVSVTEFLVGVRGKMSKQRVAVVQQAFARLDKHNDRTISLQDLMEVYSAAEHDDVRSGRKTEAEVVGEFAALWDRNGDAVITEDDFIAYYKDISAGIDNDAYFALMLRNAWQLSDEKHKTWAATC